jgi:hypothetical protein
MAPEIDDAPSHFAELSPETRKMLARMDQFEVQTLVFILHAAKAGRWVVYTILGIAVFLSAVFGCWTAIRAALGR